MTKRKERGWLAPSEPLWGDLPVTGDLVKDIRAYLQADLQCGPCGCAAGAADPLLERALKEVRSLRRQVKKGGA
jgi:hypothetical protein